MDVDTRTFESELAHFGVKGMRWGVRKRRQESSNFRETPASTTGSHVPGSDTRTNTKVRLSPTPVQAKIVPGKPVQTRGGKRFPTVDEAIRSAGLKQKYHASGKQALTNEEMRFLADRLTLEDRLSKLAPRPKSKGRVWTERFLKSPLPMFGVKKAQEAVTTKLQSGTGTDFHIKAWKGLRFTEQLLGVLNANAKTKSKKKD